MKSLQQHLNKVAEIFYRLGGETAMICPGSRNAPIIVAFNRHPKINCIPVSDERSAAFISLGVAVQTKKPVAIICTSGTATINFYPAICEAFYQQVPLIAITADRPPELIDQWDGQAIRQQGLYKNHILKETGFPYPLKENAMERLTVEMTDTMALCVQQQLPVHINIPLNEPFYPNKEEVYEYDFTPIQIPSPNLLPPHQIDLDIFNLDKVIQDIHALALEKPSLKILVVIGFGPDQPECWEAIAAAQKQLHFPIIADIISNYQYPDTVRHYDLLLNSNATADFQPDLLITLGNAVLSKNLRKYLRKFAPAKHLHIAATGAIGNPFQCLSAIVRCPPQQFFNALGTLPLDCRTYQEYWRKADNAVDLHQKVEHLPFGEAKAAAIILESLPHDSLLELSNSMPVRYAMVFGVHESIAVHANRGTSGIDGCTSTAVGVASTNEKFTTLITGDISFFYDVNALWNTIPLANFRIILLNNGGGGIFRLIEGPKELEELTTYLENAHARTAKHIALDFNYHYQHAANEESLKEALKTFFETSHRPKILEIFTDKFVNEAAWQQLKTL